MRKRSLFAGLLAASLASSTFLLPVFAAPACNGSTFDSFSIGSVDGQGGWVVSGPYDQGVVANEYGYPAFGCQSWRISNGITSGSFGDQTFSPSAPNEAGETSATNNGFSGGTRQTRFIAQFDIGSTSQGQQPGLFVSVSPDRGDGSRMSYLGFGDDVSGIDVTFYDVQGTSNPANFVPTVIANDLSRAVPHTIKFVMDFFDGPSNDVVQIYIDGALVHTGTSWENYYRFDTEASAEQTPRTTDSLIFRAGGGAVPSTIGNGYVFDNYSLSTSASTYTVTIDKYINGAKATPGSANNATFPMQSTWTAANLNGGVQTSGNYSLNSGNAYRAITSLMDQGADYTTHEVTGGPVVGADCSTGQPFALQGYKSGNTVPDAEAAPLSPTPPSFTGLTMNKFVLVMNQTCASSSSSSVASSVMSSMSSSVSSVACVDVSDANLVGHWKLDEEVGTTAIDSAGGDNTGTHENGPTYVAGTPMIAPNPSALSFDGSDDQVRIANSGDFNFGTGDFTVAAFTKGVAGNLSVLGNFSNSLRGWGLYHYASERINFFGYGDLGTNDTSFAAPGLLNGQWHHVAAVYSRAGNDLTVKMYYDGVLIGTNTSTVGDITSNSDLLLGKYLLQLNYNGSLDDVRVYGRALNDTEIQDLYNGCAGGSSSSSVASSVASSSVSSSVASSSVASSSSSSVNVALFCDGKMATIYVSGGKIVGGSDDGKVYKGKLSGTWDDDVIVGTSGADKIDGGNGNDTICGRGGNDKIDGGNGHDTLFGEGGNDKIDGGNGDDYLDGGNGNDNLEGGNNDDMIVGGPGNDAIELDNGTDIACAGMGNDKVRGGFGNDKIDGGPGNDVLKGEGGSDQCVNGESLATCEVTTGTVPQCAGL